MRTCPGMERRANEELPEAEAASLHAWVSKFDHRGGGRRLGLEPWYIDGAIPLDATADARDELASAIFAIIRELTAPDAFVHFADVQHEYARFYPHRAEAAGFDDLYVDGETTAYVAVDRSWGVVAFTWVCPIVVCAFGEAVVSRLLERNPRLLAMLVPLGVNVRIE